MWFQLQQIILKKIIEHIAFQKKRQEEIVLAQAGADGSHNSAFAALVVSCSHK